MVPLQRRQRRTSFQQGRALGGQLHQRRCCQKGRAPLLQSCFQDSNSLLQLYKGCS